MEPEAIKTRLQALQDSARQLDGKFGDTKTKDYFMRPVWNALGDVERFLLPNALKAANASGTRMWAEVAEFELDRAAARIEKTIELIGNYGTAIQIIS
jgi:hypothetical protein